MPVTSFLGSKPATRLTFRCCVENEVSLQQILRMIVEQRAPEPILEALCQEMGSWRAERQVVFFRLEGGQWTLAARGDLTPAAEAALAAIAPERLSELLFKRDPTNTFGSACAFDTGWARHLYSGSGEVVGLAAGFADGPALPFGFYAIRIESVCLLAAVAMEQSNLLREVAFRRQEPQPERSSDAQEAELSIQRTIEMIGQQRPMKEVLGAICGRIGATETERQAAFFLIKNGEWTLATHSGLTPHSRAALDRIDPEQLSAMLFQIDPAAERRECSFDSGWARHLYSGTGEVLAMMVGISDPLVLPSGLYAARIESACSLAVLALEQRNLLEEVRSSDS